MKLRSLILSLEKIEEDGIKEKEFKKLLKIKDPIYTLEQCGKYLYGDSEILNKIKYAEVVKQIKKEKPGIRKIKCLLRLTGKILGQGSLKKYQNRLWKNF